MNNSSIITGHSHSFDVGIACELGIHAAIIFNHILYWLRINASKKNCELIDGKVWMYEKQQDMADFLGYLTIDEIKKAVGILVKSGLLITDNYNKNKFDKTNWYTTADQSLIFKGLKNSKISFEGAVRHDRECPGAPSNEPYGTLSIIHKDNQEDKPTTTTRASAPAPVVFDFLVDIGLSADEMDLLSKEYANDPESLRHAVKYATHKGTHIKTTIIQTIRWAAKAKPPLPPNNQSIDENKALAEKMKASIAKMPQGVYFDILNEFVEIGHSVSQKTPEQIKYTEKGFIALIDNARRKYNIILNP